MSKILYGGLATAALGVFALGVGAFSSLQSIPSRELEKEYLTENDRFVDVSGARVRVREQGSNTLPTIVLVHGFTYSLETWDEWTALLENDFHIIRYDLLGHGLTGPDPNKRYSPVERARFIGELFDALSIPKAILVGNSLGALAAWRFASEYPDRVEALGLISPGAFVIEGGEEMPVSVSPAMKAYLLTAPEAAVRAGAELVVGESYKVSDLRLKLMRDMIRREGNGAAMVESLEEFTLPDPSDALQKITAPTFIMWGAEDKIIPVEQGPRIASLITGAEFLKYDGVGHIAQEEIPQKTVSDFVGFLKRRVHRER
ncbi:MAG: alpha/beta hydrolase [Pseudomonadota bacterium]